MEWPYAASVTVAIVGFALDTPRRYHWDVGARSDAGGNGDKNREAGEVSRAPRSDGHPTGKDVADVHAAELTSADSALADARADSAPADARADSAPAGAQPELDRDLDHTFRHSYSRDRATLVRRLRRIEGQVRGIERMIEREEYCVDILQQTAALRAAVDAVALLILEDHVQGCVRTAAEHGEAEKYVDEVLDVVRRTLGRPVRTPRAG